MPADLDSYVLSKFYLICDGCGTQHTPINARSALVTLAKNAGWTTTRDDRSLCPTCSAAAPGDEREGGAGMSEVSPFASAQCTVCGDMMLRFQVPQHMQEHPPIAAAAVREGENDE